MDALQTYEGYSGRKTAAGKRMRVTRDFHVAYTRRGIVTEIFLVPSLPVTATGKVIKDGLRMAASGTSGV
jgi:hypothetical protein